MSIEKISKHYDDKYFDWHKSISEFGGWANRSKFSKFIKESDTILDFGCGGGFLLDGFNVSKKIGIEINPAAIETAKSKGIEVYNDVDLVADNSVDVVISNHALEHTLKPLDELKSLLKKLKKGGKIIVVVPCDNIINKYKPNDINHHLYSWSPLNLGNIFTEAGFELVESKAYISKWPPKYQLFAKLGRPMFEFICKIYGRIARKWFQVRAIGIKP